MMENKNSILLLGLLLLIAESLVMVAMYYFGMDAGAWLRLLWDVGTVGIVVISAIVVWLRLNYNTKLFQLCVVAAKTGAVIVIAESSLMMMIDLPNWRPALWQAALMDGMLFAVMAAPIIFHWAIKPIIKEDYTHTVSLPIQMCVLIMFAGLMFDLSLPLGVAGGVPYVMLVLVGLWFRYRNAALILAFVGTVLTVIGYLFSDQGGVYWMVITNRTLAISAIWVTAVLVMKYKIKAEEVARHRAHLEAALESEKKFSALQRHFVSMISHEFRTPLSIIDAHAQRLKRTKLKVTPDELEDRSDKIRFTVERMVGLVDTVLYASSLDEGMITFNPGDCDIKSIAATVCEHQALISQDHEICVDIDALPPKIFADEKLLSQVLQNVLSNAVKYSPQNPLIKVKGWVDGGFSLVSVQDHGVGIPQSEHGDLFQRFFRATTSAGIPGTGLGLSICREFLEMHGGDMAVDSVEGEGTIFTIKVPIHKQELLN